MSEDQGTLPPKEAPRDRDRDRGGEHDRDRDPVAPLPRIRVLNGPLCGSTHLVRSRLGIGRASTSDIQLVHDGISRQHAQVVTDERGRHVLVDLDSSNGTFINGQRIRREVLVPGTVFKIMRVKLVYEVVAEPPVEEESGVFALHTIDRSTLRGTIDYSVLDLPQPAAPRARAPADTLPVEATPTPTEVDSVVSRRNEQRTASVAAAQARGDERHRIIATRADGSSYAGSLIDDIVDYRELRVRIDRGDETTTLEHERFERLESQLRQPEREGEGATRREFNRFHCNFPAKLRFASGDEISAAVLDLGVDGTRLRVYDHQIEHDAIVWLAIFIVSRGRAHTVVLTGRVAWTCRDHLGLGFAGAPGWEQLRHRKVVVRTHMDLGEQLQAARATQDRVQPRSGRPPS